MPLAEFVGADGTVGDVYGKRVIVAGRYLPAQQITDPGRRRDRPRPHRPRTRGRSGVAGRPRGGAGRASVTPPPTGHAHADGAVPPRRGGRDDAGRRRTRLGSVRMPLLAQRWPQRLVPGFVTLSAEDAAAQGLAQASVTLPQGRGAFQNGGYALQWWIFAAFALGSRIKLAHSVGAAGGRTRGRRRPSPARRRRGLTTDSAGSSPPPTPATVVPGARTAAGEDDRLDRTWFPDTEPIVDRTRSPASTGPAVLPGDRLGRGRLPGRAHAHRDAAEVLRRHPRPR